MQNRRILHLLLSLMFVCASVFRRNSIGYSADEQKGCLTFIQKAFLSCLPLVFFFKRLPTFLILFWCFSCGSLLRGQFYPGSIRIPSIPLSALFITLPNRFCIRFGQRYPYWEELIFLQLSLFLALFFYEPLSSTPF